MLRSSVKLLNPKKMAFRLFREEQRNNSTLSDLSAIQRLKVVKKMFKQMSRDDLEALKKRAILWESKRNNTPALAVVHRKKSEITPYELFYKEQSTNLSFSSIQALGERERKLFEVYNKLPESTREELERRAQELSNPGSVVSTPAPKKTKVSLKNCAKSSIPLNGKKKKKMAGAKNNSGKKKISSAKESTKKKVTKSAYGIFVKEQMPHLKHLPPKERLKAVAEKWKALKSQTTTSTKD